MDAKVVLFLELSKFFYSKKTPVPVCYTHGF